MGILSKLFGFGLDERNAKSGSERVINEVAVNLIDMWQANRPLGGLWDVKKFNDEGYRRNAIIFSCITLKAISFMEPELKAYLSKANDEAEQLDYAHMLSKLLLHPNKRQSQSAFMRAWSTHLDVAGAVFAYKVRNSVRMPIRLQLLQPDLVKPIVMYSRNDAIVAKMEAKGLDASQYEPGDIIAYSYGVEPHLQYLPACDIIHEMAHPDPLDPFHGLSPIAVLARMGDLDNYAADYLRAFFLNAGIPSGILKLKTAVDKDQRLRVKEQWKEKYSSIKGWFDVFVTDADVEYQEIGSPPKVMDLEQVFGETESRICGTFGVHPVLIAAYIGLLRSTMANYEQARKHLYQNTMKPMWVSSADRLSTDLAEEFGPDLYTEYDLSDIDALKEDKQLTWDRAIKAYDSGLVKRNEARAMVEGLECDEEGGDVYKISAGTQLIEAGELPMSNPQPQAEMQEAMLDDWEKMRTALGSMQKRLDGLQEEVELSTQANNKLMKIVR
jgi:HK97 family phage portal protein